MPLESANAMASRIVGVGNIIGYVFGYINLPRYMWFFGNTQFKVLCVIASIALSTTVAISCTFIKERDPRLDGPPSKEKGGVFSFFKSVFSSIKNLPPQTRKVCEVQFFAWIGWFPFLFYLSTWIGELYVQPFFEENPNLPIEEIEKLYNKATRIGTFALLIWAIASLTSNLLLPLFIAPTYENPASSAMSIRSVASNKSYTTRFERFLDSLVIPWLSLRRAWMLSLIIFALAMFSALVIQTPTVATIVVGVIGIPWAMTLWAPFAIISAEISKRDALRRTQQTAREVIDPGDDNGDQAGVILGIHNVSIAAPQVIATLGSSLIFRSLQKPRGTPGDRSMPVVLAVGGIFALTAAYMASRLAEEKEEPQPVPIDGRRPRPRRSLSRSASFGGPLEY
jgi:solute carrier family 45 protein 1/2/4